jgi:hypothetical protein
MTIWKKVQDKIVLTRLEEEALHAVALEHYESGERRKGLWAKALIESEGNLTKAEAIYLRLLVTAMKDELYISGRLQDAISQDKFSQAIQVSAPKLPAVSEVRARGNLADLRDNLWDVRVKGKYKGAMKGRELRYFIKTDGLSPQTEVRCNGQTDWISPDSAMPYLID